MNITHCVPVGTGEHLCASVAVRTTDSSHCVKTQAYDCKVETGLKSKYGLLAWGQCEQVLDKLTEQWLPRLGHCRSTDTSSIHIVMNSDYLNMSSRYHLASNKKEVLLILQG